jgi:hypothetical protein
MTTDKERLAQYQEMKRAYWHRTKEERKEEILAYHARIEVKLAKAARTRIFNAMKRANVTRRFDLFEVLGCTATELMAHLEKKFAPGMSWDNFGKWHMDHIRAVITFDLTDHEQFKACFHFSNTQPLWAEENNSKHSGKEK